MPPRPTSPPAEFDDYIRDLRTRADVAETQLEEYVAQVILDETRKGDALWVSFVDSFITSIRRVIQGAIGGDEVLEGIIRRLEAAKGRASGRVGDED